MVTPWARSRIRRRLAGIAGPDEQIVNAERLRTGGWWVTTDEALYELPSSGEPERVPLSQIRSVRALSAGSPVLVVTAPGHQPLIGDLAPGSQLAEQLRQLRPEGSA